MEWIATASTTRREALQTLVSQYHRLAWWVLWCWLSEAHRPFPCQEKGCPRQGMPLPQQGTLKKARHPRLLPWVTENLFKTPVDLGLDSHGSFTPQ